MEIKARKINAVIFGSTGMVGEGVLHTALEHPDVESVLVIVRRPTNVIHSKLIEFIHDDFYNYSSIEAHLNGYNACFFCLGVSSIGMNEKDYTKVTYDLTLQTAKILSKHNPAMTFCYVSGQGTDITEKGHAMWARVKGKTENDLSALQFKAVYSFRPGYINPIKGLKHAYKISKVISLIYPLLKTILLKYACELDDLGMAMIQTVKTGYEKKILENRDITFLAETAKKELK
jgi:uncharacterized protein YbjT (DUF2867 family)